MKMSSSERQPNIVLVLADNLGWGELGCYGGGALRGAPTPRIDSLADEGLKCLNFNVESDCVPTRSALMTGRHPIRTGALQSVPAGLPQGIHPWEITLPQVLKQAGYDTAMFGKWHLGDRPGRYPNDRGFDEWYGIPRTSNETLFTQSPGFDQTVVDIPQVMEGFAGQPAKDVAEYDLEKRRLIDSELTEKSIDFMRRKANGDKPFFLYVPLTHLHFPTLAHPDFAGKSGVGEFADSMMEMDYRVGELMDAVKALGIENNTLFIFASDNGPEFRRPWRGTAGPWSGTYHTAMEGGLRVPLIVKWPGHIDKARVSDDIVHVTDLFTTLIEVAGVKTPTDRPIDGLSQLSWWKGLVEKSAREGFLFYIKTELRAVKWRHWKLHFVFESEPNSGTKHLETPWLFNIKRDPKEETDAAMEDGWVRGPMRKMIMAFEKTLKEHPPIAPGASDQTNPNSISVKP
ncbi:MAG: arylsulfatase [Limnohabitans sp.]|jgi:arylsulfatase A-like enzyme|nr:arylsulfatase [Limnohabitans sp.]